MPTHPLVHLFSHKNVPKPTNLLRPFLCRRVPTECQLMCNESVISYHQNFIKFHVTRERDVFFVIGSLQLGSGAWSAYSWGKNSELSATQVLILDSPKDPCKVSCRVGTGRAQSWRCGIGVLMRAWTARWEPKPTDHGAAAALVNFILIVSVRWIKQSHFGGSFLPLRFFAT